MTNPEQEPTEHQAEQLEGQAVEPEQMELEQISEIESLDLTLVPSRGITVVDEPGSVFTTAIERNLEAQGITDAIVVNSEMSTRGPRMRFNGLTAALEHVCDGRPIILLTFMPLSTGRMVEDPRYHALLGHPHVEAVQLPANSQMLAEAHGRATRRERPADPLAIDLLRVKQEQQLMGVLQHNLPYAEQSQDTQRMTQLIEEARQIGFGGTDAEVIEAIRSANVETLQPFAGKSYPGIFCDVDGTLRDQETGQWNQRIIDLLHEKSKTSPITIWTGGSADSARKALSSRLPWKVIDKRLMAGAEVEFAIDDQPQYLLESTYGVKAKGYLQVRDLL